MSGIRALVDLFEELSVRAQCQMLGVSRGARYCEVRTESPGNLDLRLELDTLHLAHPAFGSRGLSARMCNQGQTTQLAIEANAWSWTMK